MESAMGRKREVKEPIRKRQIRKRLLRKNRAPRALVAARAPGAPGAPGFGSRHISNAAAVITDDCGVPRDR